MVWCAWLACCRHRGVPSPRSPEETRDQLERMGIAERMRAASKVVPLMLMAVGRPGHGVAECGRQALEKAIAAIDDELRLALTPAVNDALLALDLADEVERLLSRARAATDEVVERLKQRVPLIDEQSRAA